VTDLTKLGKGQAMKSGFEKLELSTSSELRVLDVFQNNLNISRYRTIRWPIEGSEHHIQSSSTKQIEVSSWRAKWDHVLLTLLSLRGLNSCNILRVLGLAIMKQGHRKISHSLLIVFRPELRTCKIS